MPLQKQILSLPFVQGVDTKTDARLSPKPSRLENSIFVSGDLHKHPGRQVLTNTISSGGTQSAGEAVFAFNNELTRLNGGTTYGLAPAQNEWVSKPGGNNYCTLTQKVLVATQSGTGTFDHAIVGGIGVVAWIQSGLHVAVYDVQSGTFYQTGLAAVTSSVTGSAAPRLLVMGGKVVIVWADIGNGNIYSAAIDTTTPTVVPTQSLIRTDLYTSASTFDAVVLSLNVAVIGYPTSGTDMKAVAVDSTGTVLASPAPTSYAAAAGAAGLNGGVLLQKDVSQNVYFVYADGSLNKTRFFVANSGLTAITGFIDIVTTGNWNGTGADFVTGASIELTANHVTVFLSRRAGNKIQDIGFSTITNLGVHTVFTTLNGTPGLLIIGDAISYDGTTVFGVVNSDTTDSVNSTNGLQSSAWVINSSGQAVAKGLLYQTVDLDPSSIKTRVAHSYANADNTTAKFLFYKQERVAFSSAASNGGVAVITPVSVLGIALQTVTKTPANQLPINQIGNTIYIGGGYPRIYDGELLGELGFTLYPFNLSVVDAGAGNLSAGTYQWRFLYSWFGANGELIRGPVSPAQSLTLAASHSATISMATMPLAMRDLLVAGGNTQIEVYRTQANGSNFNRQSSVLSGPQNNPSNPAAISITDNSSDTSIATGELLYTTGGILDWEAPPAYAIACAHQQRLVVVPSENPFSFMPSSTWAQGQTVRFSTFNIGYIPSNTGPITGIASMDGKLVLLTQSAGYFTLGDGPDNLGNNQYPAPQVIVGMDTGPIPGSPCVTTPLGIIYQSPKGLTLLGRDLNQNFIGAPVEAFTIAPWVLRSIVVNPRLQHIYFQVDDGSDIPGAMLPSMVTSNGGYRLTFDYFHNQWTVDPAWGAQQAIIYQGNYTQVRSDGALLQETPAQFLDNNVAYTSTIETPWLKMGAAVQGFQRLYYVTLIGTYYSDFTLQLDVAYSYAESDTTVPTYLPGDTVQFNGQGIFTPGGQFEIRHHLGKKCSAVKFRIRDINILGNGQGMGLTELALEYGIKKGTFKLPAQQTA